MVRRTQAELREELIKRFGNDWRTWAFVCPSCGDVATGADFEAELHKFGLEDADGRVSVERYLGQQCIGRVMGCLSGSMTAWRAAGGRGCDWVAFGLFRGPEVVVRPDGKEIYSFRIADPEPERTGNE